MTIACEQINEDRQTNEKILWKLWFDNNAPIYEKQYREHPFWRLYNDITLTNIKKYLPAADEAIVLDAGGGTGFWSRTLAELDYKVICADISEGMLREGRKMIEETPLASKIDFVCADITNLNMFPSSYFSFILAEGDPISYCGNPNRAVEELSRVAKYGAHVIASVDSFFGALLRMFQANNFQELEMLLKTGNTSYTQAGTRQHNFTVEEIKDLFLQNGLEVIEVIGKPIFTMAIPWEKMERVLADEELRRRILELELMFNNHPDLVGLGNHIEIVGKKSK